MIKKAIYDYFVIHDFYENLEMRQKNNVNFEYEIRVDNEQVVPRTKDLNCFFDYDKFISTNTSEIQFLIYKGQSRTYDKYIYYFDQNTDITNANSNSIDIEIDRIVAEKMEAFKKEVAFNQMVEKLAEYKEKNNELKEKISQLELEVKEKGSMKDVISALGQSGFLTQFSKGNNAKSDESEQPSTQRLFDEFSNEELFSALQEYKVLIGTENFEELLGIFLKLAEYPNLIPEIKAVIKEKTDQKS